MAIDTTNYKTILEEQLDSITKELETLGVHNPAITEDWTAIPNPAAVTTADENEVADRSEDWQEKRATLATLETRYNNIRRALGKIETGTYGICEISGTEIEVDRLNANPAARTCKAHLEEGSTLAP